MTEQRLTGRWHGGLRPWDRGRKSSGPGLATLSGTMLAGRLLPWAILWWIASTSPEEDVAVG